MSIDLRELVSKSSRKEFIFIEKQEEEEVDLKSMIR